MHKKICSIKTILLLFSFSALGAFSCLNTLATQSITEVLYQVDKNYPPFTYSNQNHVYGFDPDFTNLLFNSNEYTINYSYDSWNEVYKRIVAGEIDIAGIIAITDERKNDVLFTDSLFSSSVSVYTRKNYQKIDLADLPDLKVGVGQGYYTEEILKQTLKLKNYISYVDLNQAINDLENGKIDVIFEDHWLMDSLFVVRKDKGQFISQITNLYPLPHAYAVNKNNPELVNYMNLRITELKKSGVFDEIYMKYFYSHSEYYLKSIQKRTILLVASIAIGVLFLFLILKIYIDILKRHIFTNYEKLKFTNHELANAHDSLQSQYEEIQAQYEEIQAQYEEIEISRIDLERSEERYKLVTSAANDGLWDWDMVSDVLYISEKWVEIIGFPNSAVNNLSKTWRNYISLSDEKPFLNELKKFWEQESNHFSEEIQVSFSGSDYHWFLIKAAVIRAENNSPLRMAGTITDINDKKQYEDRIYQLAYYDYLTKIPNRVFLQERLEKIFKNVIKSKCMAALYYLDLDNFKHINDTLGHTYGDYLLIAIAKELATLETEHCYVFRVGGDEFIVIIENLLVYHEILKWADKILTLIRKDWKLPQGETFVSASMGVTVIPNDGIDIHKLLKSADAAMYEAKGDGKGTYKLFKEDMLRKLSSRSEMEKQLRKAIEKKQFQIYYQPYYQISDRKLIGLEALIRWNHPVMGSIPPSKFIPIAEEFGLIKEIGQWVMKTSCVQNKLWQNKGYTKIPVAVNVSELQLEDRNFISFLKQVLRETGLEAQYLHIEVTESCIMKFLGRFIELLKEVQSMGIQVALDDFGTGYSSLNYLQNLPINTVKIDKSFIDEIVKRSPDTLILSEIISIAHKLNITVIAEGLESIEQVEYLESQNCDFMQGYYMNKPMDAADIESILSEIKAEV